jgi:hypothetical protein
MLAENPRTGEILVPDVKRRVYGNIHAVLEGRSPEIFLLNNEAIREMAPRDVARHVSTACARRAVLAIVGCAVETWRATSLGATSLGAMSLIASLFNKNISGLRPSCDGGGVPLPRRCTSGYRDFTRSGCQPA